MSLVTTFRNAAIGILAVGAVVTVLGVALPFATGAYEGPEATPPSANVPSVPPAPDAQPPVPDAQPPVPTQPGAAPGDPPLTSPSIDTTNLDLITAGGPLGICLFHHNVYPAGGTNDDPNVPFNGYPDAGAAFAQFRNDVIRELPDQVLEVFSEGQAAGAPGAGPIVVVVPQNSPIGVEDVPVLAASSTKATAAYEHLAAAGVEFRVSAHALGPMTEICALHQQIDVFSQAQAPGDGTLENPGFSAFSSLDVQAGVLHVSTLPEYAEPLRQSLASVGDAFVVTDDGQPIFDASGADAAEAWDASGASDALAAAHSR